MIIPTTTAALLSLLTSTAIIDQDFGELSPSDPTWDRVAQTGAMDLGPCNTQAIDSINNAVAYDVYYVRAANNSTLLDISVFSLHPNPIDLDPMLMVYCGVFDPSMPNVNLEEIDDDSAGYPNAMVLSSNFANPDNVYSVVVSSYSNYPPSRFGDYTIEIGTGLYFSTACHPDFNGDGNLNFLDISEFLALFGSMDIRADYNHDGNHNFLDVSAFLDDFGLGCP